MDKMVMVIKVNIHLKSELNRTQMEFTIGLLMVNG